jgi:hypothetical protein
MIPLRLGCGASWDMDLTARTSPWQEFLNLLPAGCQPTPELWYSLPPRGASPVETHWCTRKAAPLHSHPWGTDEISSAKNSAVRRRPLRCERNDRFGRAGTAARRSCAFGRPHSHAGQARRARKSLLCRSAACPDEISFLGNLGQRSVKLALPTGMASGDLSRRGPESQTKMGLRHSQRKNRSLAARGISWTRLRRWQ